LVPKHVLDNAAALHPGDGVLDADPNLGELAVGTLLDIC
jgi:hypothetical protein